MKKTIIISLLLALVCMIPTAKAELCVDLIAGQFNDVGDVCVSRVGNELYIQYTTDPLWPLNAAHVHVSPNLDGIPQKNGNPIPGQFLWTADEDGLVIVPLIGELPGEKKNDDPTPYDWTEEETLILAVHGVVGICDCEALIELLPDEVTATVTYPGDDSYFTVEISGDGILNGTHKGWCADVEDPIEIDEATFVGDVYSSICEDVLGLPPSAIIYDANLPLVNWLLNNREGHTAGSVQYAIWDLLSGDWSTYSAPIAQAAIDSIHSDGGLGWPEAQNYDAVDGLALAEAAEANGGGYWPECGDVMAVIFVPPAWGENDFEIPLGTPRQSILIEIPAPCGCQTAWGGVPAGDGTPYPDDDGDGWGLEFPGKNWALYFTYAWE